MVNCKLFQQEKQQHKPIVLDACSTSPHVALPLPLQERAWLDILPFAQRLAHEAVLPRHVAMLLVWLEVSGRLDVNRYRSVPYLL